MGKVIRKTPSIFDYVLENIMNARICTLCLVLLTTVSCDKVDKGVQTYAPKTTDLGTGLNAVERTYDRPAGGLFEVSLASLRSYELKIETDRHDDLGGEVVAVRADGHKVTVT